MLRRADYAVFSYRLKLQRIATFIRQFPWQELLFDQAGLLFSRGVPPNGDQSHSREKRARLSVRAEGRFLAQSFGGRNREGTQSSLR